MLVKTLILGLISAGAAGAVVYYGTVPNAPAGSEPTPIAAESRDISALQGDKIAPRAPTVKKGYLTPDGTSAAQTAERKTSKMAELGKTEALTAGARTAAIKQERSEEKSDATSEEILEETSVAMSAMASDEKMPEPMVEQAQTDEAAMPEKKPQTRWLDQYLKKNAADTPSSSASPMAAARPSDAPLEEAKAEEDMQESADSPAMTPAANMALTNQADDAQSRGEEGPRYFKIEDGKLVEVSPEEAKKMSDPEDGMENHTAKSADNLAAPDGAEMKDHMNDAPAADITPEPAAPDYAFTSDISNMADDSTPMIATVMKEAAMIKKPELRDQAYFEITEFALSEGRFESARIAHDMIMQDELAYTAKSRIAVAYAQNGQASKAFKTISEVEEAELRDFMRLQVIEALIAPENLPQGWQEKQ